MNSTNPSFEELYPLLTLPRIPDLALSSKVVIPKINSIDSTVIDIGISKSIISSYIIKPTPKLIWSFALSPTSIVDCMDVAEASQNNTKLYAIGITNRKKHKLMVLERGDQIQENEQGQNKIKTMELKVSHKIQGVKFFNEGSFILVIFENGNIELIKEENDELINTSKSFNHVSSGLAKEKLVYYEFINDIEISNAIQAGGNKELLLMVFESKDSLHYKLISLNFQTNLFEINSKSNPKVKGDLRFTYNSGHIYQLNLEAQLIESVSIVNFSSVKSISIKSLGAEKGSTVSLCSPSPERLVLSIDNKIHLINFRYESLLDTFESDTSSNKVMVNQVVSVKGNSVRTSRSMICYLNSKAKENNVDLNVININVGLNKLNECLGKSIEKSEKKSFQGLVNLIEDEIETPLTALTNELNEIYLTLSNITRKGDVNQWERILVPYLKNESWDSIKSGLKKTKNNKVYNFQEFDIENDRTVDCNFIQKVLGLIFDINSNGLVQFKSNDFIPEYTLIYLLTNPIFPIEYTNGLLKLLDEANQFTCLRQAVITCPNLSVVELLTQLLNSKYQHDVDESTPGNIFEDLINRIIGEFSVNDITNKFKQLIENQEKRDSGNVINLDNLLNRLLKVKHNNNSWYFIELVIDVGGLFNWSLSTIESLSELIESKVSALVDNSYNLTLTNQALLINAPVDTPRKPSKKKKSKNDIISTHHNSQLESILTINNNTSNRRLLDNPISKKIPNYSIEKLVI
ncbi:uncharacterized protein CANTADRAFT_24404 [Suhomyces tanzawaensis NRRL Y-17324]|uniref:U3 small nucleolar RNA-associated protein 8 n=1 Tax=Suhomyces tanzawaensis NRRL Y-17324 TaxID=984487 RepID=A0A1E4SPY3_9ASCO|nr:uncharacterized protein CANTADRAFT_24404 [Suhomyces tanzawaensis NRRL Y-17324]ODV81472.1 hypothetical protein CANTADRAFT_24404 [Suhomyces tanzawaensis NRRL Y-17324]